MKIKLHWLSLVTIIGVVTVGDTLAFYNPQIGRWVNRDPIGEEGFTLLVDVTQATVHTKGDKGNLKERKSNSNPIEANLYGFVVNDPQNRIDPLGLISFDGCDEEKEATLTASWNSVCKMVYDPKFQCCVGRSGFIDLFKRRCAWGNVKFKCRDNDEGLCPSVCAHAWQSLGIGRGVIVVCDRDPSECGVSSWKCLLAHEFSHVIGHDPFHMGITPKVTDCCNQH